MLEESIGWKGCQEPTQQLKLDFVLQFQQWSIILGVNLFKTNQEVGFDFSCVRRLEQLNSSDLRFSWRFTWVSTLVRVFSQKWAHQFLAILVSIQKAFLRSSVTIFSLSFVQICICSDFRAFKVAHVQTIVRSFVFPKIIIEVSDRWRGGTESL